MYYRPLIIFLLHTLMCAVSVLQTFALLHFFDMKEPVQNWIISSLVVVIYLFSLGFSRINDDRKRLRRLLDRCEEDCFLLQEKEFHLRQKIRKLKKNV